MTSYGRSGRRSVLRTACGTSRGRIGLTLVAIVALVSFVGPMVPGIEPNSIAVAPFAEPSQGHLLGGDILGRDVLDRVLSGGWLLLIMAVCATALGVAVGTSAGIIAGYRTGLTDGFIMRTADVFLAIPNVVLALLLVSVLGSELWLIVLAVALGHAPSVARVIRAATLGVAERDFVHAVELQGVSVPKVIFREILPNLSTPLMVETGLRLTYSIVIITGLAFLGFGQPPPGANWGVMINENRVGAVLNLWPVVAPALCIALLTIGVNTFTDAFGRVSIGIDREAESVPSNAGEVGG